MKRLFLFIFILLALPGIAQETQPVDTSKMIMNMDAVYTRPFMTLGKTPVAVGGYVEANTSYFATDGITDGLSFQMRRLTIFMSSTISKNVKFLSEIEFEDGTKEINIEFAAIDFEFHPLFNLRGGVIMNPIGAFNQNHDGPKWEFIDRPIMATQMLPATWSNVGFGFHGKKYTRNLVLAYETYLTNGFDGNIIANSENKTFLPATKLNRDRFEESANGVPLLTSKIAVRHRKFGELGFSHMGGVYNKFQDDGIQLDKRRRVDVWAIDFNSTLPTQTYLAGEIAFVNVDVPETYTQQFGSSQLGAYFDVVQPIWTGKLFNWENAVFNLVARAEYIDWNKDSFRETGDSIADEITAIVPGLSLRPTNQTVIRFNYRYHWQKDLLGNPAAKTGGFQLGISSYF